jgi:putative FmdB family regulatory protein
MPFYEYQCKNCGHELEAMQKVSDDPLKKCPNCGKSQLQRLMSAPVFRLKGGGWYETDFKGDSDNKRNLADRPESDSAKESDAKTPAAAADAKPAADAKTADKPADKAPAKESGGDKPAAKPDNKSASRGASKPAAKKAVKAVKKAAPKAKARARR